jgi:hypothetical protein
MCYIRTNLVLIISILLAPYNRDLIKVFSPGALGVLASKEAKSPASDFAFLVTMLVAAKQAAQCFLDGCLNHHRKSIRHGCSKMVRRRVRAEGFYRLAVFGGPWDS